MILNGFGLFKDGQLVQWWPQIPDRIDIPEALRVIFAARDGWSDGEYSVQAHSKTVDDPPPVRRMVSKATILSRLTDEQLSAILAAMTQRQRERWRMPGYPAVYADDPEVLAVLQAFNLDADVILAPEG